MRARDRSRSWPEAKTTPWEHCGRTVLDNVRCPACGHFKDSRTVSFERTRLFSLGAGSWEGDGEAQADALRAAHEGAVPLCEP